MLKKISGAMVGLGLLGSQACAVDGTEEVDNVDGVSQELACYTNNGVNPMLASLAVAMAKGIGEINAVRDLKIESGRVKLSTTGRNKCNANGGCTNIDAILDMQNDAVNSVLPTSLFNATNYRNTLVASYERQKNWESNLAQNNPGALPDPHQLVFSHEFDNGGCDTHFVFDALKAGCTPPSGTTGSCGLPVWQGGNWQFTVQQGQEIEHLGRKYRANQYIGYPNVECAPNAPASWCANWFTDLGTCGGGSSSGGSCAMQDPNDIVNRLAFFENGGNDFLAFYATASEVAIDPLGTMVDGAESDSGSCVQANQSYCDDGSINGTCCQRLNGVYGTFQKSSFNPTLYLCKAN